MKNLLGAFIASTAIIFGMSGAFAAEDSDTLSVRLNIRAGCTLNFDMGRSIDLGTYANIQDPIRYPSSFSVRCSGSNASTYSVVLDNGLSENNGQRRLKQAAGTNYINYEVYRGDAPVSRWADGADSITGTRNPDTGETVNRHNFLVYVPGNQVLGTNAVGEYVDMLTATVTYTPG